jgi:hypothetical protein
MAMVNGIAVQTTGSRTSTRIVKEHNSYPLYYIITFILTKTKPNPDRNPNSDPDPDPNPIDASIVYRAWLMTLATWLKVAIETNKLVQLEVTPIKPSHQN